jgi:hypothetical protein
MLHEAKLASLTDLDSNFQIDAANATRRYLMTKRLRPQRPENQM